MMLAVIALKRHKKKKGVVCFEKLCGSFTLLGFFLVDYYYSLIQFDISPFETDLF